MSDQPEKMDVESEDSTNPEESKESENDGVSVSAEETPEGEASSNVDDGTSTQDDWVVPGRFRTTADLIKSYQHLESEFGRRSNELHNLKQNLKSSPDEVKRENEQFAEAVKRNPVEAIRNVVRSETDEAKAEARKVRFETEYTRLMGNAEFAELEPTMVKIAEDYKELIKANGSQNDPRLLHVLYYAAKGVKQEQLAKQAESRGRKKGEAAAIKKTKAQLEGTSGTKGHTTKKFEELSLAEMREELNKGNI